MRISKIVSFSVAILLITVVFAGAVTVPAAAQDDTMQFRYNAQHSGDYSLVAGPVPSNGQLRWMSNPIEIWDSSPAVANGVVYVGSFGEWNATSQLRNGTVYAFNATTGAHIWNFTTRGYVGSSPAVANDTVYVGSNDNNVYALNATTGAQKWNYSTGLGNGVHSSPAVVNGVVYVGSNDGNVYALNANNGTKLWNYTTGNYVNGGPAVANGVVYVGSDGGDGNVSALNATTGAKLWSFTTGSEMLSSPAVANGVVYVGNTENEVYALNANNGTELWNFTTGSGADSSPAVVNGVVYVGSGDGNVYALYANNGTKLWNYTTGNWISSSAAVANGVVYDASTNGNIYALNAGTGTLMWQYSTGYTEMGSPSVVNGIVYIGIGRGNLYALGNEAPSAPTTLTISALPIAVVNKPLVLGGALNTTDGTPVASATIQLQKNVSGSWQNVAGKTSTTTSTGAYRISTSEPVVGTYLYRTTYAGNATHIGSNSTSVNVKVVSKASVLNDLVALGNTVSTLPASAFVPGTRTAALAVIGAAEINVGVGSYGGAATTLQTSLLPRTNGCAASGKPDSDDWVRTCAAQAQVYPQVLNVIQEIQALQGS